MRENENTQNTEAYGNNLWMRAPTDVTNIKCYFWLPFKKNISGVPFSCHVLLKTNDITKHACLSVFPCFVPLDLCVAFVFSPSTLLFTCLCVLVCAVCVCLSSHMAAGEVIQLQTVVSQFALMGI